MPEFFAASSARNIWVFGTDPNTLGTTTTFRWNGAAWQQGQLPSGTGYGSAAVISASRIWYAYGSNLWRLSGSRWIKQPAEADVDVAAGPGSQVWQAGQGTGGALNSALVARRWTGTSWQRVRMPHPVIKGSPQISVGSARDVWIMVRVAGNHRYRLLHWNGHHWRTITVPAWAAEVTAFACVTAVGSDSAWFSGNALWDGQRWLAAGSPLFPVINVPPVGVPGTGAALAAVFTGLWISGRL